MIKIKQILARLDPLRSGAPLITPQELAQVDDDWVKWRAEWVRRKKVFNECVSSGSIFVPPIHGLSACLIPWTLLAHRSGFLGNNRCITFTFVLSPFAVSQYPSGSSDLEAEGLIVPKDKHTNQYIRFWALVTDPLPPQDAAILAEDLGIEFDTDEHVAVERGPLCAAQNLKRKRI